MPIPIAELTQVEYPAWSELSALFTSATNDLRILPGDSFNGRQVLYRLQMTAKSMTGAIVLNCGAVLVDHGWIKVLGSGVQGLPNVATASSYPVAPRDTPTETPGLMIAVDAVGGQYAIDSGDLVGSPGEVCYWGQDTLTWTGIGAGHYAFLSWLAKGDLTGFYRQFRWSGWQEDTAKLGNGQGFGFYPFPWAQEFGVDTAYRRVVDLAELFTLATTMASQIHDVKAPLPWPTHIW